MKSLKTMINEVASINEAADQRLNVKVGQEILKKMVMKKAFTSKAAYFLGINERQGLYILQFGPQSSAQAQVYDTFPKASNYYDKNYDMSRAEFLEDAKIIEKNFKTRFMTALKKAKKEGVLDNFDAINKILEIGADISAHNKKVEDDPMRSWKLLDKAISGKDLDQELMLKKW